jgi:hypothetical protein
LIAARKRQGALVAAANYSLSSNQSHFVLGQLFPSDFLLLTGKNQTFTLDKNPPGSIWSARNLTVTARQMPK